MLNPITDREYKIRMLIILLSFMTPILCIVTHGYLPSLSRYWNTALQPLFILTNVVTASYFFRLKRWKIPAMFLLLLTSFSVEHYNGLHNILSACFFISVIYPFVRIHHYKWLLWVYMSTLIILFFNMLMFEIAAITTICLYHSLILYKVNKLNKNKKNGIDKKNEEKL